MTNEFRVGYGEENGHEYPGEKRVQDQKKQFPELLWLDTGFSCYKIHLGFSAL